MKMGLKGKEEGMVGEGEMIGEMGMIGEMRMVGEMGVGWMRGLGWRGNLRLEEGVEEGCGGEKEFSWRGGGVRG